MIYIAKYIVTLVYVTTHSYVVKRGGGCQDLHRFRKGGAKICTKSKGGICKFEWVKTRKFSRSKY